jgi:hypothetical protein
LQLLHLFLHGTAFFLFLMLVRAMAETGLSLFGTAVEQSSRGLSTHVFHSKRLFSVELAIAGSKN